MSHSPVVSIIMPNFNKGPFAKIAVQSVLAQTFAHWELIFVDDHATDESTAQVAELAQSEPRILLMKTPTSQSGGGVARNMAMERARGRFIIFMDSDDWMAPDCLARRVEQFNVHIDLDFLVFPVAMFRQQPGDMNVVTNQPTSEPDLLRFIKRDLPWHTSGPIWKRSFLQKQGIHFNNRLLSQQDLDFHVKALVQTDKYQYFHNKPLLYYRMEVDSVPRQKSSTFEGLSQRVPMIEQHIHLMRKAGKLGKRESLALAAYLLDIAQKYRWFSKTDPQSICRQALAVWRVARDEKLVSEKSYSLGKRYVRFKHRMLWNRLPSLQQVIARRYEKRLGELYYRPSATLGKSKWNGDMAP